jgi:hypothetical protein
MTACHEKGFSADSGNLLADLQTNLCQKTQVMCSFLFYSTDGGEAFCGEACQKIFACLGVKKRRKLRPF